MFIKFSCTSVLLVLLCCWCCVASNQRKVTFSDDAGDEEEDKPSTDYRTHCKDRVRNQDETDIDCGGMKCPKCANSRACKNKCDCISGVCEDNKCVGGCVPACKNNGKCIDNKCSCPTGFRGATCEIGEAHGLCSAKDLLLNDPIFTVTFGNGVEQYSRKTPKDFDFTTTYKQKFEPNTEDGYFSFINSIHDDFGGSWHTGAKDHTGDQGGYMFLVNADYKAGQFYKHTMRNLCIGRRYQFAVYLANVCKVEGCAILPNVKFQIRGEADNELLAELDSGDVPRHNTLTWRKYGLSFTAKSHSVVLLMISNTAGGGGNDLAIDDISLHVCGEGPGICHGDL